MSPNRNNNPYRNAITALKWPFLQVGLLSAAINVLMLTGPIYMLQVYDRVLSSGSVPTLLGLFLIVVVLYTFFGLYEFLRARLLSRAGYRLDSLVGAKAFEYWLKAGISQNRSDDNPMRDLDLVRGFLASPAILGVFDLPWVPLFLGIVFLIHPWLGWLTMAGACVVALAAWLNQITTQRPISESVAMDSAIRSFTDRSHRNAEAVVALGMSHKVIERWVDIHRTSLALIQKSGDRSEGFAAFSKSFRLLLQSMLLTLGAYLAIRQEVSAGAIIATSIIAGRALAPVDQVIGQWRSIARALEAHRRIRTTLDGIPNEVRRVKLPDPIGMLKVTNLTKLMPGVVRTAPRTRILDSISFDLVPGDGLGVIGNSAAGKSSLAKLIVGAWQADAGEVRLDGALLEQWPPEDLGAHIGYLPQQLEMLPGTIAQNISRFDQRADDKQIVNAAKIARVHEMILALPEGYSTQIGNARQPLSGGQIQRLGLARAVYRMPRLIVLDEPNSNLDGNGDDALSDAILELRKQGCVVIVMAHRPSVISAMNKVMIINSGKLLHFGIKEDVFREFMRTTAVPVEAKPAAPAKTGVNNGPSAPQSADTVTELAANVRSASVGNES